MKKRWMLVLAAALLAPWASRCWAEDAEPLPPGATMDENGEIHFPFDKGPETIDVSNYPKKLQGIYTDVFTPRCSKCHTLARPINAPFALPEEWQAYVTKMSKKKRSGVSADDAKQVIEFLTYDSSVRKKDVIAQKLKEKEKEKAKDPAKDEKAAPPGKTDDAGKP